MRRFLLSIPLALSVTTVQAFDYEPCGTAAAKTREVFAIGGTRIHLRKGPGKEYKRLVAVEGDERRFVRLSTGHIVKENCRDGEWSQVSLLAPEQLRKTHRGWIKTEFLIN